ncbi:MAG TPA: class I SAM-dependent methyltransferase, partial [Rhodothermales bacterium]|nr:class I SAM-dependent methyltransferase [Rhodothermales bacterium]
MTAPAATAYDEMLYPNRAFPQTHPERLATIATLYGLHPAPPTQCRVLEIGCGHGWNVFPMAYDLPESEFLGFDIAARPIALGTEDAKTLGLDNLRLEQRDILDDNADLGCFDYIIAHGVYTWTPPAVRDRVLMLCHKHLAPQGVAYISYVVYPGGYMTQMTREMMQFHMQHFEGAHNQVRQARAMLKLLVDAQVEDSPYRMLLEHAYQRVSVYPDEYLYHDDLSTSRDPCYFHQFADHARRHQLQYLSEAVYFENFQPLFPPHVKAALDSLGDNLTLREQYLDFLHGRNFRQSLLCHQEAEIVREDQRAALNGMYLAAPARALEKVGAMQRFKGLSGSFAETDALLDQAALEHLGAQWPAFVAF